MEVITCLLPGKDDEICAGEVRTIDKSGKPIVLIRPIKDLWLIEVKEKLEKESISNKVHFAEISIKMVRSEKVPEIIKKL